jgi:hypothetical protein
MMLLYAISTSTDCHNCQFTHYSLKFYIVTVFVTVKIWKCFKILNKYNNPSFATMF